MLDRRASKHRPTTKAGAGALRGWNPRREG